MIFKKYYRLDSNLNPKEEKIILESIAKKFNSEYDDFIRKSAKEKEKKIIKLKDAAEIKDKKNNEEKLKRNKIYYIPSFKNRLLYYNGSFYVYTPSGTRVERVSQGVLGNNVLGRAFPGLNIIQILDTLYGLDFEEVKKHEVNHILYPFLTEDQIRLKTKQELPFYTKYH